MKKRLAVIGCGWLGRQCVAYLIEQYRVLATVASQRSLAQLCFDNSDFSKEIYLLGDALSPALKECEVFIIAVAPSGVGREAYAEKMAAFASQLPNTSQVILVSSTSVYPQAAGVYDEESECVAQHALAQAEQALLRYVPQAVILRSAGQYGKGRYPVSSALKVMDKPLNMVSGENLVLAIAQLLAHQKTAAIYNLVEPTHYLRSEFYPRMAEAGGFVLTHVFETNQVAPRLIKGDKIVQELGFVYR